MVQGIPETNIPSPDPSLATNERLEEAKDGLRRDMAAQREECKGWVEALQLLLESRIAGKDTYYDEKFLSIQTQFRERDVRTDQTASQVKLAVDAALQAQKEAAGEQAKSFSAATTKSETAMNRQIEGLDGKITDVKDRLNRVEAMNLGAKGSRSESNDQTEILQHRSQNQIAWFAALASAAGILLAVIGLIYTVTRQTQPPQIIYQPGTGQESMRPQHQLFPLAPSWDTNLYKVAR